MVIFDILSSHWHMAAWHEARTEVHLADMGMLAAARADLTRQAAEKGQRASIPLSTMLDGNDSSKLSANIHDVKLAHVADGQPGFDSGCIDKGQVEDRPDGREAPLDTVQVAKEQAHSSNGSCGKHGLEARPELDVTPVDASVSGTCNFIVLTCAHATSSLIAKSLLAILTQNQRF